MAVPQADRRVLRDLAAQVAEVAALPVHREKAEMWRRLNDLEPLRPMVWITETPWNEMEVDGELAVRCTDEWCRRQETHLRRLLYQWRHMPGDMIVSDYLASPLAVHSTGFGLGFDEDVAVTDPTSAVVGHAYHPQIVEPADVEKIKTPLVTHDEAASERQYERMCEVYRGVMPVRKVGPQGVGIWPWDLLTRWFGITESLLVLVDRPQMAHDAMDRLTNAYMAELTQMEDLGVLSLNNDNTRTGSGAYGYTRDLPADGFDPARVRARDVWGSTADQLFSHVSPDMHWEFGISYELRYLTRCGLTYYGCCEPLDDRIHILRRIPNLRKVSMSPWVDPARGAEALGTDYVYSCKPSPAIVAEDRWRPERAREVLRTTLEKARGCRIEIIMKDISTVRYEPQRLWEWERIATELAEDFAP